MARRGRKRRLVLEDEYWALLASGLGTREACRQLGIGRKTGWRWRAERGGIPPAALDEAAMSGRYLSMIERQQIAVFADRGLGVREIARRIGRAASTVSRELRRNRAPHDRQYDAALAHARARARARRERAGRLLADPALRTLVQSKLELDWSPQQISAWLRLQFPENPSWHVCHETIYQAIYWGGRGGLSRELTARLRTGRPLRKRRRRSTERRSRFVAPIALIDTRPAVVEERTRVGDWEGDLIVGRSHRSAIATLVDRTSRLVRLVRLPAGHTAPAFTTAMTAAADSIPVPARLTLTWDQGSEMARHDLLAQHFPEGVYFARPGSPWLRGTNENTNGLLRQYFPKYSDLSGYDDDYLRRVEDLLNHRPRRILDWRTPTDVFTAALAS